MTLLLPIVLASLGLLAVTAAARALAPVSTSSPSSTFARLVLREVWAEGEWSNGRATVRRDARGQWTIRDRVGTTVCGPDEVESELRDLYYRDLAVRA